MKHDVSIVIMEIAHNLQLNLAYATHMYLFKYSRDIWKTLDINLVTLVPSDQAVGFLYCMENIIREWYMINY